MVSIADLRVENHEDFEDDMCRVARVFISTCPKSDKSRIIGEEYWEQIEHHLLERNPIFRSFFFYFDNYPLCLIQVDPEKFHYESEGEIFEREKTRKVINSKADIAEAPLKPFENAIAQQQEFAEAIASADIVFFWLGHYRHDPHSGLPQHLIDEYIYAASLGKEIYFAMHKATDVSSIPFMPAATAVIKNNSPIQSFRKALRMSLPEGYTK